MDPQEMRRRHPFRCVAELDSVKRGQTRRNGRLQVRQGLFQLGYTCISDDAILYVERP